MNSWGLFKRYAVDSIKRWQVLILWSTVGALVLHGAGLSWSFISVFLFGLFAARELARDVVQRWSERYVSPGIAGGISIANPRVWTFKLILTKTLIEEVSAQLSSRFSEHKEITDDILPALLNATSAWLQKLVIEEYPTRVRAHLWLVPTSDADSQGPRYDWFDVDFSQAARFEHRGGWPLWAYATDAMVGGALTLSGSWEWDTTKKRDFFQLTLWVDHCVVRELAEKTRQIPPTDIIFKIPLEPGRLCDEQGRTVYVEGKGDRKDKASEVERFPYDEDRWEHKSGEGSDWRWSWYLHMKTFNSGFSNWGSWTL